MKLNFRLLTLAIAMLFTFAASATVATMDPNAEIKAKEVSSVYNVNLAGTTSVSDILTLNVKDMETKLGRKMSWKEKGAFKLAKYRFQRAEKKGKLAAEFAKSSDGSIGIGFALGFFLGFIGVLIAYLAFKDEAKTIKGSWYGLGAAALLYIIFLVIFLSAAATTTI
jgi:hypothetical protein